MSDGYGMKSHVAIGFQSAFGSSDVTSLDYFCVINETLSETIEPLVKEGMCGRFEEGDHFEGMHSIAGDVVTEVHPILIGKLIQAWTNANSDVTLVDSVYNHVMKPAVSDFSDLAAVQPMTLEIYRDAGSSYLYYDSLVDALTIEIAQGVLQRATASFLGGKFTTLEKTAPSYLPGSEYTWDQTSISFGDPGSGIAIDEITQLTISCTNALEGKGTLDGTKTPNRIKRTDFRRMEIAGTILFTNDTEAAKFRAQTAQRMVISVAGQDVSSGYPGKLTIDMPRVQYITEFSPQIAGPGQIEVSFTGAVKYHSDSATMAEFTLQNTHSAY